MVCAQLRYNESRLEAVPRARFLKGRTRVRRKGRQGKHFHSFANTNNEHGRLSINHSLLLCVFFIHIGFDPRVCARSRTRAVHSAGYVLAAHEPGTCADLLHSGAQPEGELLLQAVYSLDKPENQTHVCEAVRKPAVSSNIFMCFWFLLFPFVAVVRALHTFVDSC